MPLTRDEVIQLFINVAKSELKSFLKILFINHRLLPTFKIIPRKELLGLVEICGQVSEAKKFIGLAKGKFSMRLSPEVLQTLSLPTSLIEQLTTIRDKLKPEIMPELIESFMRSQLSGPIPLMEKTLVECVGAFLLEHLITLWDKQPDDIKDNRMIEYLNQQELILSSLQVSVCPKCGSFELIIGSYPLSDSPCFKCNVKRICARVYAFDENFSRLKISEEDLPLFICKYLDIMSASIIKAEPFKWFTPDTEVDVYVKESMIGVECKSFIRELTISEEDVKSKAGELVKKLERYYNVGIKKVIIVTSLSEHDSNRLHDYISKGVKSRNIHFEGIKVVPGIVNRLLNTLDDEVKELLKGQRSI